MEVKLALNYLGLSVKTKIAKNFFKWKQETFISKLKKKLSYKRDLKVFTKNHYRSDTEQISLTEPSPVSTKILKKNKQCLANSSKFNAFWTLIPEKSKGKPTPIKLFVHNKFSNTASKFRQKYKENDGIAIVSCKLSHKVDYY